MTGSRDLKRYDALREMGCVACRQMVPVHVCAEIHHLVDKGYRKHSGGNQATIPLCPWHHRGVTMAERDERYMRALFGPSMRLESREFAKVYGTQRELLARVNEMLKEHA